jgi:hypothetical protein
MRVEGKKERKWEGGRENERKEGRRNCKKRDEGEYRQEFKGIWE